MAKPKSSNPASTRVDTEPRTAHELQAIHLRISEISLGPNELIKRYVNPIGQAKPSYRERQRVRAGGAARAADVGRFAWFWRAGESSRSAAELAINRGKLVGNADAGRGCSRRR